MIDRVQDAGDSLSTTTFRDYVKILFRQKEVVVVTVLTMVAVTLGGLLLKTPQYEAKVKLLISGEKQVQGPYYERLLNGRNIEQSVAQGEIVISSPVLERVVKALVLDQRPSDYEKRHASPLKLALLSFQEKLGAGKSKSELTEVQKKARFFKTVDNLRKRIKTQPIRDTDLFTISVLDSDPEQAATLANVISRSYIIFDLEQQFAELTLKYGERHPLVQQLADSIKLMSKNLNGGVISNIDAMGPASVKIIDQANVPFKPFGPPKKTVFLLGLMMSLFAGITLAFVFDYMDPTFKSSDDIERELSLQILGSIPRRKRGESLLVHAQDKRINSEKFYRALCDQILFLLKEKHLKSILLSAAGGKEGSSTVMANLGTFLSERTGLNVLLMDANFRDPSLHKIFKMDNIVGFSDIIEGRTSLKGAVKEVAKNLHIISAGETTLNPAFLLDSLKTKEALLEAGRQYEIVLLEGPDLVHHRDSVHLATFTDAVVVIVSEGQARRLVIKAALQPLLDHKANVLGLVVNNRTFPIPKFLYDRV